MMPKRVYQKANQHPMLSALLVVVLVAGVGFWRLEHIAGCGQEYAEATTAANEPIREANAELDAAQAKFMQAAEEIFAQDAGQEQFDNLRIATDEWNRLYARLKEAREDNPPPEPPGEFC